MKRFPIALRLSLLVTFYSAGCAPAPEYKVKETAHFKVPKSVPRAPQAPVEVAIPGLPNFGFVTTDVWRGGEPTAGGLQTLATMGAKTVIDLREGDESAEVPKGVTYVRLPCSAFHADQVDVDKVLAAIKESPKPVFIHCREGRDRTGMAIAAYRLSQGMSAADACRELRNFHVNFWWDQPITRRVYQMVDARIFNAPVPPAATRNSAPESAPATNQTAKSALLAVGDPVRIIIPDLMSPRAWDKRMRIAADGTVSLPYVGPVKIAGMTPEDAENTIRTSFRDANIFSPPDPQVLRDR